MDARATFSLAASFHGLRFVFQSGFSLKPHQQMASQLLADPLTVLQNLCQLSFARSSQQGSESTDSDVPKLVNEMLQAEAAFERVY